MPNGRSVEHKKNLDHAQALQVRVSTCYFNYVTSASRSGWQVGWNENTFTKERERERFIVLDAEDVKVHSYQEIYNVQV